MNKQRLSQMRWKHVRVRPIARRFDETRGIELEQIDDVWLIANASRDELDLCNPRSQQHVLLGTDHVREYLTDAGRSNGMLVLKSQILLFSGQLPEIEPLIA